MLNQKPSEQDLFREALGPGPDCPPIDELANIVSGAIAPVEAAEHLRSCPYCQTELHLLRTFESEEAGQASREALKVDALLRKKSKEIIRQSGPTETKAPWWKAAFAMRALAQASLAMALILAVAGLVIHFRSTNQPTSIAQNGTSAEVFRSGAFSVISPTGDLRERPEEVQWEKVSNAVRYQVRLLEVDGNELWKAETFADRVDLPASVRARIVPAKTLFLEVTAFDSGGSKVGDTGQVRFRLLQPVER